MVRYFSNIRFCSFNVEGLKNKLEEKEFYDTISKFDFITFQAITGENFSQSEYVAFGAISQFVFRRWLRRSIARSIM